MLTISIGKRIECFPMEDINAELIAELREAESQGEIKTETSMDGQSGGALEPTTKSA